MALFLCSELLDLGVGETDQEFDAAQVLARLVQVGLVPRDSVVDITHTTGEHARERIEVLPVKWSRLRHGDFLRYAPELERELK